MKNFVRYGHEQKKTVLPHYLISIDMGTSAIFSALFYIEFTFSKGKGDSNKLIKAI